MSLFIVCEEKKKRLRPVRLLLMQNTLTNSWCYILYIHSGNQKCNILSWNFCFAFSIHVTACNTVRNKSANRGFNITTDDQPITPLTLITASLFEISIKHFILLDRSWVHLGWLLMICSSLCCSWYPNWSILKSFFWTTLANIKCHDYAMSFQT